MKNTTKFVTGQTYEVPCAELLWKEDGRVYYLPVIDLPHTDLAFDFPHRHYHIDGRFAIHPRMKHRLKIMTLRAWLIFYWFVNAAKQVWSYPRAVKNMPIGTGDISGKAVPESIARIWERRCWSKMINWFARYMA